MAFGTRVAFEAVRELAFGSIGSSYAAIGTPLTDHVRLLSINNSTNAEVYISFDGVTNQLRLAPNSFKLLDLTTNRVRDDGLFLAKGTVIWVKDVSAATTSGSVWVEVMYGAGGT